MHAPKFLHRYGGGHKRACFALCLCIVSGNVQTERSYVGEPVRLGIVLPISGSWSGGRTIAGAASLAIDRINRDASLLKGKMVDYTLVDGGCNATQGLKATTKLLEDADVVAIIGPGALSFAARLLHRVTKPTQIGYDRFLGASGCDVGCESTVSLATRGRWLRPWWALLVPLSLPAGWSAGKVYCFYRWVGVQGKCTALAQSRARASETTAVAAFCVLVIVIMVIATVNRVCLSQALVTAERNLLQISYACSSPLLSDSWRFPTVRRLPAIAHVVVGFSSRLMLACSLYELCLHPRALHLPSSR